LPLPGGVAWLRGKRRAKLQFYTAGMNHSKSLTEPPPPSDTNCFGIKGKRCWPPQPPAERAAAN